MMPVARHVWPAVPLLLLATTGLACGEHEFHPPDEEERVAEADSAYSPALFDTVAWADDRSRIDRGNLVFADHCRRCHGALGRGDTEYARENDLVVPSLVDTDWPFAGDVEAVRRRIFTGHTGGMRTWGIGRLTPRQIDAAAFYIIEQLRPEVLRTTPAP